MRWLGVFAIVAAAAVAGGAAVKPPAPPSGPATLKPNTTPTKSTGATPAPEGDASRAQSGGGTPVDIGGATQDSTATRPKQVVGLPPKNTTMSVTNGTGQKQWFYITLTPPSLTTPSYPQSEEVWNLGQVVFTGNFAAGEGVITPTNGPMGSATQGHFFLNAGNTANYAPTLTFSANIYVNGTAGTDNSQCITDVTQGAGIGATFAEVTLNVDGKYLGGEVVDISEVNGVNALWEMSLPLPSGNLSMAPPSGNYPYFFSTSGYLFPSQTTVPNWGTFGAGQLIPVESIANNPGASPTFSGDRNATLPYGAGTGTVGVYPFGCDNCTSRAVPGCPSGNYPAANLVEQTEAICQVYRAAQYQVGGNIGITLKQFPYP